MALAPFFIASAWKTTPRSCVSPSTSAGTEAHLVLELRGFFSKTARVVVVALVPPQPVPARTKRPIARSTGITLQRVKTAPPIARLSPTNGSCFLLLRFAQSRSASAADSLGQPMSFAADTCRWGRERRSLVVRSILLVALVVAVLAATASTGLASSRVWYRGHVRLGGGGSAPIHLLVRPGAGGYVDRVGSDRIPLQCNQGSMWVRIHPGGAIPISDDGHTFGVSWATNTTHLHFRGRAYPHKAHGWFRYSVHTASGRKCSTGGRLSWIARPTKRGHYGLNIFPAKIYPDPEPLLSSELMERIKNAWIVQDHNRETIVEGGRSADGPPHDGLFAIYRLQLHPFMDETTPVRVPGAGAITITKAPLGRKVVKWAQKRGNIEFTSANGITGTLHLANDTVTVNP